MDEHFYLKGLVANRAKQASGRAKVAEENRLKNRQNVKAQVVGQLKKRVLTATIGALDEFEQAFGHMWGWPDGPQTDDERESHELYQKVRKRILDKANNQSRSMDKDLERFDFYTLQRNASDKTKCSFC